MKCFEIHSRKLMLAQKNNNIDALILKSSTYGHGITFAKQVSKTRVQQSNFEIQLLENIAMQKQLYCESSQMG